MEFKVIESDKVVREYTGFQRAVNQRLLVGEKVVIVYFDGEPELWHVENLAGIAELRRFYP